MKGGIIMKKILKRIAVLMCIVTLFAGSSNALAASSTVLAASTPVITINFPDFKAYQFQPSPYELTSGSTIFLNDPSHSGPMAGYFYVPAGNMAGFVVNCTAFTPQKALQVNLIQLNHGIVYSTITSNGDAYFNIPAIANDANYVLQISAVGSETVNIESYTFFYQ